MIQKSTLWFPTGSACLPAGVSASLRVMKHIPLATSCIGQPLTQGLTVRLARLCPVAACAFLLASCYVPPPSQPSQPQQSGPFVSQYDPSLTSPAIEIRNHCDRSISLSFNGPTSRQMSVPAGATRSITVPSGNYRYHASAAGASPCSGNRLFDTQHRYVWAFSIRTVRSGG